jgi:smad nuclear-interacting protein 1
VIIYLIARYIIAMNNEKTSIQLPNYLPTGLLAAQSNEIVLSDGRITNLKYQEPTESRKPSSVPEWQLYVFNGDLLQDTIDLRVKSCWLVGRDDGIVDIPAIHPSISQQHAAIQFRHIYPPGDHASPKVLPYLVDLDTVNGTYLNQRLIPTRRYIQLQSHDLIKFGRSPLEYIVLSS